MLRYDSKGRDIAMLVLKKDWDPSAGISMFNVSKVIPFGDNSYFNSHSLNSLEKDFKTVFLGKRELPSQMAEIRLIKLAFCYVDMLSGELQLLGTDPFLILTWQCVISC